MADTTDHQNVKLIDNGDGTYSRATSVLPGGLYAPADVTIDAEDTADAQIVAATSGLRLLGYSVTETNNATARIILRHGTADTDPMLAAQSLAANGATTVWFGPNGLDASGGVYLERVSGETEVAVYTITLAVGGGDE